MKQFILSVLFLFGTIGLFGQSSSYYIPDSLINAKKKVVNDKAGACGNADGTMKEINGTPSDYQWLQDNGYCFPDNYGAPVTVCWEFTPTQSCADFNSGYSHNCNNTSFGNFNLYDQNCNLIATGLSYCGFTSGVTYTWCITADAWGGPGCTGFDDFCPYWDQYTPLPIELLSFNAKVDGTATYLTWSTTTEINNDYFIVEKSYNGHDWEEVTRIKGAGNSNEVISYHYRDDNFKSSTIYYRLKQKDYDGKYSYSDIISVNHSEKSGNRKPVKIINYMGQEVSEDYKGLKFFIYENGDVEKKVDIMQE